MPHLDYRSVAPEGFKPFLDLYKYIAGSGLEEQIIHLLYLRISQINGCPYCVDLHYKDAVKAGVEPRKINALTVWRDTPFFSGKERAALHWAEAVTRLEHGRVPREDFDALHPFFKDKEIVDLTYLAAHMNALNRIAIAFHKTPEA